jgi:hypothetical protein
MIQNPLYDDPTTMEVNLRGLFHERAVDVNTDGHVSVALYQAPDS